MPPPAARTIGAARPPARSGSADAWLDCFQEPREARHAAPTSRQSSPRADDDRRRWASIPDDERRANRCLPCARRRTFGGSLSIVCARSRRAKPTLRTDGAINGPHGGATSRQGSSRLSRGAVEPRPPGTPGPCNAHRRHRAPADRAGLSRGRRTLLRYLAPPRPVSAMGPTVPPRWRVFRPRAAPHFFGVRHRDADCSAAAPPP